MKDRWPSPLVDFADRRRRLAVFIDARNLNVLDTTVTPGTPATATTEGQQAPHSLISYPPLSVNVLQAIQQVGVPVLFRVFATRHALPPVWEPYCQPWQRFSSASSSHGTLPLASTPSSSTSASFMGTGEGSPNGTGSDVPTPSSSLYAFFQLFTVEPFIPLPIQMEADADHLFRFKEENGIEGVCYVVPEVDRDAWTDRVQSIAEQWDTIHQQSQKKMGRPREESGATNTPTEEKQGSSFAPASPTPFFNQYVVDEMGLAFQLCADGRTENGA